MKAYKDLSKEELRALQTELQAQYEKLKESDIKLDMSRGKPCCGPARSVCRHARCAQQQVRIQRLGQDRHSKNYGAFDGIKEAKELLQS